MNQLKTQVDVFLKKSGMHYERVNPQEDCRLFRDEMQKGLDGGESTLAMLPTYISLDKEIPLNEEVIVMDAGGTNFRAAVVRFGSDRQPVITDFQSYAMPGTKGEITRAEFFATIGRYLAPIINLSNKIGFCFSYPTEILPDKDGKLIRLSKEVRVKDLEGEKIGAKLLQALQAGGCAGKKRIVMLNDTVATLLGGKAAYPDRRFDSFIGFILGTGTNTCYIENNALIRKVPSLAAQPGTTLINIESGGYGKAPRGAIDELFDRRTMDPGRQQFEKMISGAYQGQLLLAIIKAAAADGLFSGQFTERIRPVDQLSSREIDLFCFYPYGDNNILAQCIDSTAEADRQTLFYLIDAILERAARLVAVNLAAVILKTGKGQNPCLPVCVTAEGTTFYKSKLFRSKLDYYVKSWLNDTMGIYCEFVKADNATLVGTAIAGLLD
jgi:hexokinase